MDANAELMVFFLFSDGMTQNSSQNDVRHDLGKEKKGNGRNKYC